MSTGLDLALLFRETQLALFDVGDVTNEGAGNKENR